MSLSGRVLGGVRAAGSGTLWRGRWALLFVGIRRLGTARATPWQTQARLAAASPCAVCGRGTCESNQQTLVSWKSYSQPIRLPLTSSLGHDIVTVT